MFLTPGISCRPGSPRDAEVTSLSQATETELHAGHLVDERGPNVSLDPAGERAGRGGQDDLERHCAALAADVLDHVQADDVAMELGLHHRAERLLDGGGRRGLSHR